jgi:hypothetical protein
VIPASAFFAAGGCALGFFIAALLFASNFPGRHAQRWLGALILSVALLSLQDLLDDVRIPLEHTALGHLFDWLIFLVGPLTFIYVRRMTGSPRLRAAALFVHALPALAVVRRYRHSLAREFSALEHIGLRWLSALLGIDARFSWPGTNRQP